MGSNILHIFEDSFICVAISGPALQSEIFCLKAVIVAYNQATITAVRPNISLWSAGPEFFNTPTFKGFQYF